MNTSRAACLGVATLMAALPAAAQETYLLIVTGLGGEPKYSDQFHE